MLFQSNIRRKAVETISHCISFLNRFVVVFFVLKREKNLHILLEYLFSIGTGCNPQKVFFKKTFWKDGLLSRPESFSSSSLSLCRNFDISILCLSYFDVAMASIKFHAGPAKTQVFFNYSCSCNVFSRFLNQIAEIHKFLYINSKNIAA